MKLTVRTDVIDNKIYQKVIDGGPSYDDPLAHIEKTISEWVIDTKEKGVRNALIKLGWTPPRDCCERWRDEVVIASGECANVVLNAKFCPECGRKLK